MLLDVDVGDEDLIAMNWGKSRGFELSPDLRGLLSDDPMLARSLAYYAQGK
ncbi:predicted protein [Pyrenophora tritici-repentis Pt-1C-BFP]|uniref:Uncharacterized protein n=1 Tax=Pyrenophora tritici-repentis (strain Pt-1C-BFP) TaxID=426418 RepID=B2WQ25_PYRTR|nr:uncharacterized protein PTRG_12093 [Pyrenophora tritici-repentis Pt-1C-BFP]EDU46241.1 predicted protein [Pyrenophora tritici-repentis Pt-1C-BFP]